MSVTTPEMTGADYAADYVELPFNANESDLADGAVERLQTNWPGWEPNEADVEVVLIETLSPLAAAAVAKAATLPPAALIALGTKLFGIPWPQGAPAQTTVALVFQDDAGGYYVPGGSEFELGGYAFTTVSDVTSGAGEDTVAGVQVVANDIGVAFNDLTSSDWASVTMPVWVVDLATEAPTSDGVDPQSEADYLNTVSRELQLRGRMVVTLPDYELVAIDTPGVGRAYAISDSARNVSVYLTDPVGEPVPADVKLGLADTYAQKRLVNVTVQLLDANYTPIDIDYQVAPLPTFDAVGLVESVNATLAQVLSPSGWGSVMYGQAGAGPLSWVNDNVVRLNKIVSTIGNVAGVSYVVANSVLINGAEVDYAMPGPVALPTPGTFTGSTT